jgi:hypothetical protein
MIQLILKELRKTGVFIISCQTRLLLIAARRGRRKKGGSSDCRFLPGIAIL